MLGINTILQQDRYRIVHQFAQNELTASYEAYDNILKTNVVIKEITVNLKKVTTPAQQESRKLAFANEAKVLTAINHHSLLHVYDYFSEIDREYLVMESVDGTDLGELVEKNKKPFSLAEVALWADQLLDAVTYLHTRTPIIIHRDIKPQNIKLRSDGKIKLLIFDITKNSAGKAITSVTNQTFDNTTLNYLPLEHIWGVLDRASKTVILNSYDEKSEKILEQPADARSDIYAIGATLYYLATGQVPIDALERSIDTLEGKADPLPSPNELNPAFPIEVSDILMKAMEIRRENRFDSAVIMRHILRSAVGRIRQNEAEAMRIREAEAKLSEEKRIKQERLVSEQKRIEIEAQQEELELKQQILEQKKLEAEAEQKRQAELIQQQLEEAKAEQLLTELKTTKAEKLFDEDNSANVGEVLELEYNEVLELDYEDSSKSFTKPSEVSEVFVQPAAKTAAVSEISNRKNSSDEFDELFAVPQKNNKFMVKVAAAAVILMVLAGSVIGILMTSKSSVSPDQSITDQSISSGDKTTPKSTAEPTPVINVETVPETTAITPDTAASPTEPVSGQFGAKNKPVSTQTEQTKKPVVAVAKPTPIQKKNITVDDIINDN